MKMKFLFILVAATLLVGACKNEKKIPPPDWKRNTIGNLGLSMETPFIFKEKNIENQLTPEIKALVKEMHTFFEEQGENFYGVTMAEYTDEVTVSIDGAMEGAIREMTNKAKGTLEDRKDEDKIINGNQAHYTTASIVKNDKDKMEVQMVVIAKGQRIFQTMGLYRPGKDEVRKNVKRMIESMQIKP